MAFANSTDLPPWRLTGDADGRWPLLLASPHSGRHYPTALLAGSRLSLMQLRRAEDAFVDALLDGISGVPVLSATHARCWIDLNRAPDELDPAMFDGALGVRGTCDAVLTKLDATGRRLWTRVLGASEAGQGFSVAVGADGRVAVAGAVTGSAEPATRSAGGRDSFVAVFDANGKEQFVRQRGTSADDEARAVAFGADGTLYVGGRSRGAGPDAANAGGWDGFVVAYDTAGAAGFVIAHVDPQASPTSHAESSLTP
jgi:hypothetical protein